MKSLKGRTIILGLVLIMAVSLLPSSVVAYSSNSSLLSITHADYGDLDDDGADDDVITEARIGSLTGFPEFIICTVTFTLTLPSGANYTTDVVICGIYDVVDLTIEWYDHATESGWYKIHAEMESVTMLWEFSADAYVIFDPPEEGPPGTPWVRVLVNNQVPFW
ncbi:MAG: exported protein of unknown function [Candidatus Thorarchaeota archaeon]|nr:MAG: exported protein of unknown function [Candidatus Thorarchaeota archaeon]